MSRYRFNGGTSGGGAAPTVYVIGAGGGAPAYLNGWVAEGYSDIQNLMISKDSSGYVHIEGTCNGSASADPIFVLPVGWRPTGSRQVIGYDGSSTKNVGIDVDGTVHSGQRGALYFDVVFLAGAGTAGP